MPSVRRWSYVESYDRDGGLSFTEGQLVSRSVVTMAMAVDSADDAQVLPDSSMFGSGGVAGDPGSQEPDVLDFTLSSRELVIGSIACLVPLGCVLVSMVRARTCREPFLAALAAQVAVRLGLLLAMVKPMSATAQTLFMDVPGLVCVSVYTLLVMAWAKADSDAAAFDDFRIDAGARVGYGSASQVRQYNTERSMSVASTGPRLSRDGRAPVGRGSLTDSDEEYGDDVETGGVSERQRSASLEGDITDSGARGRAASSCMCLGPRAAASFCRLCMINLAVYFIYFCAMGCMMAIDDAPDFMSTASPAVFFFLFATTAICAAVFGCQYVWARRERKLVWVEGVIVVVISASFAARSAVAISAIGSLKPPDMQWPSSALYYGLAEILPNIIVAALFPLVPSAVIAHLGGPHSAKGVREPLLKGIRNFLAADDEDRSNGTIGSGSSGGSGSGGSGVASESAVADRAPSAMIAVPRTPPRDAGADQLPRQGSALLARSWGTSAHPGLRGGTVGSPTELTDAMGDAVDPARPRRNSSSALLAARAAAARLPGQTDADAALELEYRSSFLKCVVGSRSGVDWSEIAGLEDLKRSLQRTIVVPEQNSDLFSGVRAPARGVLLYGLRGVGKTMLAKAVARACGSSVLFFNIAARMLIDGLPGEGERRVKALFALARKMQPSVICIDDVDLLLGRLTDSTSDVDARSMKQFMVEWERLSSRADVRVTIMGLTKRPQVLDPSVISRMSVRLYVSLPAAEARHAIIKNLFRDTVMRMDVRDALRVVQMTEGWCGADIAAMCGRAASRPAHEMLERRDAAAAAGRSDPGQQLRPVEINDFMWAIREAAPANDVEERLELDSWDREYGTGGGPRGIAMGAGAGSRRPLSPGSPLSDTAIGGAGAATEPGSGRRPSRSPPPSVGSPPERGVQRKPPLSGKR